MRPPLRPDQIAHLNREDEVAALRKTEEQYAERILQQEEEIRALRKRVEELERELRGEPVLLSDWQQLEARAEKAERERDEARAALRELSAASGAYTVALRADLDAALDYNLLREAKSIHCFHDDFDRTRKLLEERKALLEKRREARRG